MPELSVIIPAYNEEQDLSANVLLVDEHVKKLGTSYEIVLVNDGSRDKTLEIMHQLANKHIRVFSYDRNYGKGYAVRHGMQNAQGKFRLFMDVDLSTSLEAVDEFLRIMRTGQYNILIGERPTHFQKQGIKQPFIRRFLGKGFSALSRFCVGQNIKDFTCGFKMFDLKASEIICAKQRIFNWSFDTELVAIASIQKLKIGEIPVLWSHRSGSQVRALRDVCTSLAGLFKIKWNMVRGVYR